jgi:predicted Co/Zn/Cd cation transporter (cation efflux family)
MQNTRLSNLLGYISINLRNWLTNPWRRISLGIIGLLSGYFLGSAIPLISGQAALSDIIVAAIALIVTELISFLAYRRSGNYTRLGGWSLDLLNALKIGFIYSMFVESFKLGS